jgi:hypothetical protein
VTAPLAAVPSGVVTEKVYVPGGTVEATLSVTGKVVLVTPVTMVVARPG